MIETTTHPDQIETAPVGPGQHSVQLTGPGAADPIHSRPEDHVQADNRSSFGYVVRQFHRPKGIVGRLAGWIMSQRRSNQLRNQLLVDMLDLRSDSQVLEIGPGPGLALAAAADKVTAGRFVAVDHSDVMLGQTALRNRDMLQQGRLQLIEADAAALPDELCGFDFIWAMNVWHFWDDQQAIIADLAQRLNPGGTLVVGHQPRGSDRDTDPGLGRRNIQAQMTAAGLEAEYRVADLDPPVSYVLGHRR